jgi:hypothetical protein
VSEFADAVKKFEEQTSARLKLAVQKIAIDAFSRVILRSPVDTGRFRGNWTVEIGKLPSGTKFTEDVDPSGLRIISDVKQQVFMVEPGTTIYLINNLPYARRLEYGWSKQAPGGMVRITVSEFQPIVDAVAKELAK